MFHHKLMYDADGDTRRIGDLAIKITIDVRTPRISRRLGGPFHSAYCDDERGGNENRRSHFGQSVFHCVPICFTRIEFLLERGSSGGTDDPQTDRA